MSTRLQPLLGGVLRVSSLLKERLVAHPSWAVYQCHDLGSRSVGRVVFVAVGPDCQHQTPPATGPHWSYLLVGTFDTGKMELQGLKVHPVEFEEMEEVWLVRDPESGPVREELPIHQNYRVRVRARTTASRGKGWTVSEVRGLAELRQAVQSAKEKYPAHSHEVLPEAGFEKGAGWSWCRVRV